MEQYEIIVSGKDVSVVLERVLNELKISFNIDDLVTRHTAFFSTSEMFNTEEDYFPTIVIDSPERELLADFYDKFQEALGDPRRAHRITPRAEGEEKPDFADLDLDMTLTDEDQ